MKGLITALVLGVAVAHPVAQTAGRGTAQRPAATAPRVTSVRISVRDQAGAALAGVRLLVTGATTGEFTTGPAGTAIIPNLKAGLYRVRCERDGFVTLEREFTLGSGAWNPIDVVLTPAATPIPLVKAAPEPAAPPPVAPGGPAVTVSIPDFVDKNFIGRDPLKESILACKPMETVRLLQMRENIAKHVHDRLDEIIYVIAGEGAMRIGDDSTAIRAGSLVVVPNGHGHSFERRGKNPLIVVSTLVGAPCEPPKATP